MAEVQILAETTMVMQADKMGGEKGSQTAREEADK